MYPSKSQRQSVHETFLRLSIVHDEMVNFCIKFNENFPKKNQLNQHVDAYRHHPWAKFAFAYLHCLRRMFILKLGQNVSSKLVCYSLCIYRYI